MFGSGAMRSASTRAASPTSRTARTRGRRRRWRRLWRRPVERSTVSAISARRPSGRVKSSKERVRPRSIATDANAPRAVSHRLDSRPALAPARPSQPLVLGDGRGTRSANAISSAYDTSRLAIQTSAAASAVSSTARTASSPASGMPPTPAAARRNRQSVATATSAALPGSRVPRCGRGGVDELPGDPREVQGVPGSRRPLLLWNILPPSAWNLHVSLTLRRLCDLPATRVESVPNFASVVTSQAETHPRTAGYTLGGQWWTKEEQYESTATHSRRGLHARGGDRGRCPRRHDCGKHRCDRWNRGLRRRAGAAVSQRRSGRMQQHVDLVDRRDFVPRSLQDHAER